MGILRTDKISGLETPTSNDFGPNLLYNGDFSKGTDGWTGATGGTISVSNGQLTVTNTGVNGRAISTAFDTVVGELYEISIHNVSTTGQFRLELRSGNGYGSDNSFDGSNSVAGVRTLRFVATETSHTVVVYAIGGAGTTSTYDDITVRKINKLVTGSVHFDGTGDELEIASSNDFAYGTHDFTWELWIYATDLTGNHYILDHGINGGTLAVGQSDGYRYYNITTGTSSALYTTGFGTLSTNTWYHLAAVRKDGTTSLYTNGVLMSSASDSHNYAAQSITIANYGGGGDYEFTGYISNLRLTKGTALYTEDFTPPVHALEVIGDTVLLCCNNPDSVTAEATGKTITSNGNPNFVTKNPGLSRDFTYGTEFRGVTTFDTQGYFVPPSGTTEQRGRGRGLFGGGDPGTAKNNIDYITISSIGNAQDFGDLTEGRLGTGAVASSTRAVFAGGYLSPSPGNKDTMDFVTIATTGNAVSFGELVGADRHELAGASNSTRGLFAGGTPIVTDIDYITIASLGDATDFGNLTLARRNATGVMSSTRGVFCGGRNDSPAPSTQQEEIDYVTIATTGNALDFGDLTVARGRMGSVCSSIRGVIAGGEGSPADSLVIDFITIATTGNAQDFGDLSEAAETDSGGCSNGIRGVFGGVTTVRNTMEYVTISSTGNAQDFGDTTYSTTRKTGCSDSHGGIS
jgi:hypothetical protein